MDRGASKLRRETKNPGQTGLRRKDFLMNSLTDIFTNVKQIPLVEIAQRFGIELIKRGNRWQGLCPFHTEKTPSFFLFKEKFKCFGCQWSGDAVSLVAKLNDLQPLEAARAIAEQFGIPISDDEQLSAEVREQAREKTEERRRKAALEAAFKRKLDDVYKKLSSLHCAIFQALRKLEDYERLDYWAHRQPHFEYILQEMLSKDKRRQVEALRAAERLVS